MTIIERKFLIIFIKTQIYYDQQNWEGYVSNKGQVRLIKNDDNFEMN